MLSFEQFLSEAKNTHMTHLEDKVLYGGVNGTRQAINALRELRDMLAGVGKSNVTVKWDGAPAVFAGIDPSDGEFFVAKKGIFNKNPKVYKTPQEIDDDIPNKDLNNKMKLALRYLPELGIKNVVQGDFMFERSDLKVKTIDGQKYVTFHPNTIMYAVPYDQSKDIRAAKIGIVWHTSYKGRSFESMSASFGVDSSKFKKSKNVWYQDAGLKNASKAAMTPKETEEVTKILSSAGKIFNQISGSTLRSLEQNQELAQLIEQYNNTYVRKGAMPPEPRKHAVLLVRWIQEKYKAEIAKRKSAAGKKTQQDKLDKILEFFSKQNMPSIVRMFELQRLLVVAKLKLINKLNSIGSLDTFVKTKNGYRVTGQEGYVAIDSLGGDALKIVDRLEFSYNNFSPDIVKGWENPG